MTGVSRTPEEMGQELLSLSTHITFLTEGAEKLIAAGADLNVRDSNGKTALIYAAGRDAQKFLKLLIRSGANLDMRDDEGKTALYHAAQFGFSECVTSLLEAGAQVDIRDHRERTPLWAATNNNYETCVKCLLLYDANPAIKDDMGQTPAMQARARGYTGLVMYLKDAEEKISAQTTKTIQRACHSGTGKKLTLPRRRQP